MNAFKFNLGDKVMITTSGETGEVIGRAEFTSGNPQFQVRYLAADGRATECWWSDAALEKN